MDKEQKDALYAMFLFDAAFEQRMLDTLVRVFEGPILESSDGAKLKNLLIDKLDIKGLVGKETSLYRKNIVQDAKAEVRKKLTEALKNME
ncbi:MAG: hypothetical protein IPH85_11910 [Ignavibacteria bacterium]|jgi:hypothetical protein|nr:hypothetical protein [Ignavibacteria bacterium]